MADPAGYMPRELDELPDTVKPCQFECCFPGYETAADVRSRVRDRPRAHPATGIRVGQKVEFRELGETESQSCRIVRAVADREAGELSVETPIAQGLLGHEEGEVVEISLPSKVLRVEILKVS